ncbi:hypothetical protein LL251_08640 [Sphingobium naphthae]|nr:hypothetical protein [Sphingobium naphthae]
MTIIYLFWLLVIMASSFAWRYGEKDGRRAALLTIGAAALTAIGQNYQTVWQHTNFTVMLIDLLVWLAFMDFMFASRRYFPIWMAAAQTNAVLTHFATLMAAAFNHKIYAGLASVWSIPCLLSMVAGIALDRNRGPRKEF